MSNTPNRMEPINKTRVETLAGTVPSSHPIGIFDSGVGGLTVAAAIRRVLPSERLLYIGDVARQPYGPKSPRTVTRYALRATEFLVERGVKALVVACNTASAVALDAIAARFPHLPVIGVVEAGAAGAAVASARGRILVAATEGTCNSGAYQRAIDARRPGCRVTCVPCPLFVSLAEEGLSDGPIVESVARHYLAPLFERVDEEVDCLVLGCTHFPLLAPALARLAGPGVRLVDCAEATARLVLGALDGRRAPAGSGGGLSLIATDSPDRFARIARRLLPELEAVSAVELADL